MNVLIHPKTHHEVAESTIPEFHPHRHDSEAPDRGLEVVEAPESRRGRSEEAPDAGEGRAALIEFEYTHGRSQS